MESNVAQIKIDLDEYKEQLEARLGKSREMMRFVINKAIKEPKRVVYPEGEHDKILRAANIVIQENFAKPILLGRADLIKKRIKELQLDLGDIEIIDPETSPKFDAYCKEFYKLRQRKGETLTDTRKVMANKRFFAPMMVRMGDADCVIAGLTMHYPDTISPALRIIEARSDVCRVAGMYMLLFKNKIICCADTTVNIEPSAEELADIAILTAETAQRFDIEPRIAMLSFSNFGSVRHPLTEKVKQATEIVKQKRPDLMIDGEMQADTAVVPKIIEEDYPFSSLKGDANILIFPDLASGNIAYKLLMRLGGAEGIGPILMGMQKSVHVLQRGCEVNDIVNMTAIAVVEAQQNDH